MKRRSFLAGVSLSGAPLSLRAQARSVKLTYATYLPPEALAAKMDTWFMQQVTQRSSGRITFEVFPAGSLLEAADVFPGLENGAADYVTGTPGAYNTRDYRLTSVTLPYITDRADTATKAFGQMLSQGALRDEYLQHNAVPLWALSFSESTVWSNRPITAAADLKGVRIRAVSVTADAMAALGATPVPLTFAEGIEALRRGTVDAIGSMPFDSGVNAGLGSIARYLSDAGRLGIYSVSVSAFNKARLAGLDADAQGLIGQVAAEVPDEYLRRLQQYVDAAVAKLLKLEALTVTPTNPSAWPTGAAENEVQRKWLAGAGPDGAAVLARYKALVAQCAPGSAYTPGLDRYKALKAG